MKKRKSEKTKILFIMSSYNLFGGTPKKTLDLMTSFGNSSSIYVYNSTYPEFKNKFEETGGSVFEGFYGFNFILHLRALIKIIDNENIDVIHAQFSMGETLGFLTKICRPKVKLVYAFVGAIKPSLAKNIFSKIYYRYADSFIYISNYVKMQKLIQYPFLKRKKGQVIYNGSRKRSIEKNKTIRMKENSVLVVSSLIELKNIKTLIFAINFLKNKGIDNLFNLYVAGDGPMRLELENLINKYDLNDHVFLLGNQCNIGGLLNDCDIFAHPSYNEGFGIAVAEAMHAGKPIVVSNAGALPELIEHNKSGLIVNPFKADEWADSILLLLGDNCLAEELGRNAKIRANSEFSVEKYSTNYAKFYKSIL